MVCKQTLARIAVDRRRRGRREEGDGRQVIASHWAFSGEERKLLKGLERRRQVRRDGDVNGRLARL